MWWAALLFPLRRDGTPPPIDALLGPATWALQFTPRVAVAEEAVVMELQASARLFGGARALRERIRGESAQLGATALAWAPNSLAALAFARTHEVFDGAASPPLTQRLDALPLHALTATQPHRSTLAQLGCATLGDVRRLPRGGIARRFDAALLEALDRAYGLRPEVHDWITLPPCFEARLELPARVETAPALLFGARRLLLQMCGWLAARHAGASAFTLRWAHDTMRARDAGTGGELSVRTASPMREVEHFSRLLAENLARVTLAAPVGELMLQAVDVVPLAPGSASLLPDAREAGESLTLVLERIAARLGPERVLRPVLVDDHRLEWAQHWQPASAALPRQRAALPSTTPSALPQPSFVLAQPLRLALRHERPIYQGPLQLLIGPHRVEGGWWHRIECDGVQDTGQVQRDYWVALSEHAGVLWIFRQRAAGEAGDAGAWYLHGVFA